MHTVEDLRTQLKSVGSLASVVSTMKTLSAVSIRQFEEATRSLADYSRTVELALHVVLRNFERPSGDPLSSVNAGEIAVVMGSDQGLCGRFNHDVAAYAAGHLRERHRPAGASCGHCRRTSGRGTPRGAGYPCCACLSRHRRRWGG